MLQEWVARMCGRGMPRPKAEVNESRANEVRLRYARKRGAACRNRTTSISYLQLRTPFSKRTNIQGQGVKYILP